MPRRRNRDHVVPSSVDALLSMLALGVCCLGGCASPGPPRAPSLNLPETVSSLTAQRIGDNVTLRWTTPGKSTDDVDVRGPMVAEVCRTTAVQPAKPEDCQPIVRLPVTPGESVRTDTLPPALLTGPARLIAYRLRLYNGKERTAGLSAPALTLAGPAPVAVQRLRVESTEQGALLRWEPATDDPVELRRIDAPGTSRPTGRTTSGGDLRLEVAHAREADGALDRTARDGEAYTYTAQRVRSLRIDGHTLEVRSTVSDPVTITFRDVFPPRPPSGLSAIRDGRNVDLSWEPNTEPDLAGYLVYRQSGEAGSATHPLNPQPVEAPAFHDGDVPPLATLRYTVVAIDKTGNRSAPSGAAVITLP